MNPNEVIFMVLYLFEKSVCVSISYKDMYGSIDNLYIDSKTTEEIGIAMLRIRIYAYVFKF